MLEAVRYGLKNYANFQGRTARPTFWWWVLSIFLFGLAVGVVDTMLFGRGDFQPLSALAGLALIVPNLAMGVRRLHDTGRTGWWVLIALIPILGFLVLLFFYVQPSAADSAYGEPVTGDAPRDPAPPTA
ncbi:MAG: DUF805 domain-containing protein [Phenylobacterium sp.]|uniref:DUF805 domain-containing protein n=1 Tax=Phenylobacterium sp. TaxID=1871053 RepID=UPI00271C458C|nr:DUF805 domain-containing protein [Phenylobacterium sp.]MDO8902507.1 DUF805 domain-containing protein [Phenylobacterium sp.]MDP2213293.1 DUF805 domain-containing protein [Phenylobacterium sp.]